MTSDKAVSAPDIGSELADAALSNDWIRAYRLCHRILNDSENPDVDILSCCGCLPLEHAETLFEVARDAAGDFLVEDGPAEGEAGAATETSYMLFAIPVVTAAGTVYSPEDFEALAATLGRVTGDDGILIVPEVVGAEDFLAALPFALREVVARIDINRVAAAGLDVLEPLRGQGETAPSGDRLVSFVVGARVEVLPAGTEILPETWIGKCDDAPYELFRTLLKAQESKFQLAEWPMPVGMVIPQANYRLQVERLVREISEVGRAVGVLPDALVYEDEAGQKSFVALSVEGVHMSDVVVDRGHSTMMAGDVVSTLKAIGMLVRETLSPREFSAAVMSGNAVN